MTVKFIFLILPQVHILDLAGVNQAINEAIDFNANFEIEYCGINENIVTTSGLPFGKIKHFSEINFSQGDFLIIPGSSYSYLTSKEFLKNKDLFEWIRNIHAKEINICSICVGAFVLAESGLLNGKNCTTHFKKTKALQEQYPKVNVIENILFTEEAGIYTSAGITSGIDLILNIFEKLLGSYFSHLVARELVIFNRRNGNSSQESEFIKYRNHIHSGIHKAQDYVIENISKKNSLMELAEIANMSERNFTRIFKKETKITVNEFITKIRKTKANEYLKNPDFSVNLVANKVGLKSEKQLQRILKAQ